MTQLNEAIMKIKDTLDNPAPLSLLGFGILSAVYTDLARVLNEIYGKTILPLCPME